jgi:hypothetical protein
VRAAIPDWAKPDLWLDDDNALEFIHWKDDPEPYGAHWWHRANTETGWHMGGFQWRKPDPIIHGAVWELNSFEPLDVSPSLLCQTCGAHGFIKQGKWIPA